MALLYTDVGGTSLTDLQRGIHKALEEKHQTLLAIPARLTNAGTVSYSYELSGGSASFHGENDTLTESAVKPTTITRNLEILSSMFDIGKKTVDLYSNVDDQFIAQVRSGAGVCGRKLADAIINGDGTNNTPFGLNNLATQTFAVSGALTRAHLDRTLDQYTFTGGNWAFIGNAAMATKFRDVTVAANGTSYETLAGVSLNAPMYRNIPFLISQACATNGNSHSNLYLVNMDVEEGFSVVYGVSKADNSVIGNEGPFSVLDMGYQGKKLLKTYALSTYVATMLRTPQALVKVTNINV